MPDRDPFLSDDEELLASLYRQRSDLLGRIRATHGGFGRIDMSTGQKAARAPLWPVLDAINRQIRECRNALREIEHE